MTDDYLTFKRDAVAEANRHGVLCTTPLHIEWLSAEQKRRLRAPNFMTTERWQYRLLHNRTRLVEVSYGRGITGGHLIGVTVFGKDPSRDDDLSRCAFTVAEMGDLLRELDEEEEGVSLATLEDRADQRWKSQ